MLFANALAHFLVDAVCAAAMFGSGTDNLVPVLLLYNTMAFSTQCLVGLLTDETGGHTRITACSCACVALGFFLPLPPMMKAAVVGMGNSFFHVAAGTVTLRRSGGNAAPLGLFVAPGSVGLMLGTLFPRYGHGFAGVLLLCAVGFLWKGWDCRGEETPAHVRTPRWGGLLAALLLVAIAARAIGGSAVVFPWKTGATLSVVTALCVFAGKAAGGYVCDRCGVGKTALLSLPLAALLIAYGASFMLPSLLGQFLLNLTMPVTLWLIYRCLPDSPGFAFGLAASALWPGTIAGQLIGAAGAAATVWLIVCFLFGLAAILYVSNKMKGEGHEKNL